MSADSAMKCTPQKTMNSASGRAAASRASLNESPGDVGEPDDLVALVVVAQHEHPVTQRLLGGEGARDQVGVGRRGQVPRALHAPLGLEVHAAAERQEREVDGRHGHHPRKRQRSAPL